MDCKQDLERLLKELIDKGIIYEWYNNGDGYHWSYVKIESEVVTVEQNAGENRIEGGVLSLSVAPKELNKHCKWCKGKGCNCATCHNKDEENSYYLLHKDKFPEPKEKHYRAFKNCDELVETYNRKAFIPIIAEGMNSSRNKMFRPNIWVKNIVDCCECLITGFGRSEEYDEYYVIIRDMQVSMKELYCNWRFLDGSSCGVEE